MRSAQSRILDMIEAALTDKGYEPTVQFSYSNTGTIYAYRPGDPHAACVTIEFGFQSTTYTLMLTVAGHRIPSQPGRSDYFDFFQDYTKPTAFWSTFDSCVPKVATKTKRAKS